MRTTDDTNTIDYEEWARTQLRDPQRNAILKWKAANLSSLFFRSLPNETISCVAEVGGAEGSVLDAVGRSLSARTMVNYDISSTFCEEGKRLCPDITFRRTLFPDHGSDAYDLIILSDIIEHVDNDHTFLANISKHCRYSLLKIPIEESLSESTFVRALRGKRKQPHERYGPTHRDGHLRGYTVGQAKRTVANHFTILDFHVSDCLYFSRLQHRRRIKRIVGSSLTISLFGGALFVLARGKGQSAAQPSYHARPSR